MLHTILFYFYFNFILLYFYFLFYYIFWFILFYFIYLCSLYCMLALGHLVYMTLPYFKINNILCYFMSFLYFIICFDQFRRQLPRRLNRARELGSARRQRRGKLRRASHRNRTTQHHMFGTWLNLSTGCLHLMICHATCYTTTLHRMFVVYLYVDLFWYLRTIAKQLS